MVGQIPISFQNYQSLLSLDLSNNKLNGSIPKEVPNLPSLSIILNLSKNFLDGPLPEVGVLEKVITIDLSSNRLSGNIPQWFESCHIPVALAEVKGLEVLDLGSNQLSGSIPPGKIPSMGVFRNMSNVHLEGNPNLCLHSRCEKSPNNRRLTEIKVILPILAAAAVCFLIALYMVLKTKKTKVNVKCPDLQNGKPEMISYHKLREATRHFDEENLIGSGSFGTVYKGYLEGNIQVAVKVLNIETSGYWKSFVSECKALRNVRHRNLVKLITSCSSLDMKNMDFLALVYEFLSNGSLADWISGKRKHPNGQGLSFLEKLNISIDVAGALNYLHHECEVPIVHCDLKPDNILLDKEMTAKVGDFGLARLMQERMSNPVSISSTFIVKGSIGYIPPEYGLCEKASTSGDVYSYGVMLLELFTGMSPLQECFSGESNLVKWAQSSFLEAEVQVLNVQDEVKNEETSISPEAQFECLMKVIRVGLACAKDSPDGRINVKEALRNLINVRDLFLNS
ncbi:hypothetical protein ACET3Z_028607 [Daucus carota]